MVEAEKQEQEGGLMQGELIRMSVAEFRRLGYLRELNRNYLHPLGLALEVVVDPASGDERFGLVWDSRSDPEGFYFAGEMLSTREAIEDAERIEGERLVKMNARQNKYGWGIQPVGFMPQDEEGIKRNLTGEP